MHANFYFKLSIFNSYYEIKEDLGKIIGNIEVFPKDKI